MEIKTKPQVSPVHPASWEGSWALFASAVVSLIILAATRWILAHPFGIHWDEAYYFNEALSDIHKLHSGSLRQLASILIGGDPFRPPAYRLFALPFLALFGFDTAIPRFVTLACWLATAGFIYLTSRRISTPIAAALAVLVFCLAPEVLSASTFFSTEGPLFLAVSAMLYFLLPYWSDGSGRERWVGLGLALGLGLLSKITFILIAFPILLVTFIRHRPKPLIIQSLSPILKSSALALIVAAPWWLKNIGPAVGYSGMARQQPRESFGAPSFITWAKWLGSVAMGLLGPAITVLICLVIIVCVRKALLKKEAVLTPLHRGPRVGLRWRGLPASSSATLWNEPQSPVFDSRCHSPGDCHRCFIRRDRLAPFQSGNRNQRTTDRCSITYGCHSCGISETVCRGSWPCEWRTSLGNLGPFRAVGLEAIARNRQQL